MLQAEEAKPQNVKINVVSERKRRLPLLALSALNSRLKARISIKQGFFFPSIFPIIYNLYMCVYILIYISELHFANHSIVNDFYFFVLPSNLNHITP